MKRLVRPAALLASAAAVLSLTAATLASAGGRQAMPTPRTSSAASGLGSPFASGSGTCDPTVGHATFAAFISAQHPDPIAELTTDGAATLQAYPDAVDTGGAGTVWGVLGEPLSPGDIAYVRISCSASPVDVSYALALYDAPSTPFTLSGAGTNCGSCSPTNHVQFSPPATAHYVADLTLTQGSVDLSNGHSHQVFASSGSFDLGYLGPGQQNIYVRPLDGPTADWAISVHALPVTLSGVNVPFIRPGQIATLSYRVDGDVTLSATIENSSGTVVRTLATDLAVTAGDHTLTWDGLDSSGSAVADGTYIFAVTYTDVAGAPGMGGASVGVDGTPPVVTQVSPAVIPASGNLVLDVHDALSGLAGAALSIGGAVVQSLTPGGSQFVYPPPLVGWSPGQHTWRVTATDKVGNAVDTSGTFTISREFEPPRCRVPKVIGRTRRQARQAIAKHLCSVGRVSHRRSRNRLRGRVVAQRPRWGKRLRLHHRVSLTIGLGRRP